LDLELAYRAANAPLESLRNLGSAGRKRGPPVIQPRVCELTRVRTSARKHRHPVLLAGTLAPALSPECCQADSSRRDQTSLVHFTTSVYSCVAVCPFTFVP
jgi:hypothetical protein